MLAAGMGIAAGAAELVGAATSPNEVLVSRRKEATLTTVSGNARGKWPH